MMPVRSLGAYKFLLILPVALLLVSGCTSIPGLGGQSGVSGSGIVINTFEPSLTNLESNDMVRLHLEVQNTGDVIGSAAAVLMGITTSEWGAYSTEQSFGELLPSDEERGTQGGIGIADWDLQTPDLIKGERRTYTPMVRVFYSYEQTVVKPITFLTSEEVRRAAQNGDTPSAGVTSVSAGPLSVTVNAGNYVRTKEDSWDQPYFPIEIKISNTGGGQIAGTNYPIGVEVLAPTGTVFLGDCPGAAQSMWSWSNAYSNLPSDLSLPSSGGVVQMWDGRETTITCRLKVMNPPQIREDRDMRLALTYIYFQDAETTLSVVGTTENY